MKIVFAISGQIASGKDTVAKYLVEEYGATQYRTSDIFRSVLRSLFIPETRDTLQKVSTALRKTFGDDLVAKVMHEDILRTENPLIVVDGVRRLSDISALKQEEGFALIFVDASLDKRYERLVKRAQNADDESKTLEEFEKDHERETEVSINSLKQQANYVIDNDSNVENLKKQVDGIVRKIDPKGEVCQKKNSSA